MTNLKELDGSPVNQIDDDDDVDRYVFIYYYIRTVKIIAYMPCEIISTANGIIFVLYIPFLKYLHYIRHIGRIITRFQLVLCIPCNVKIDIVGKL